MKAKKPLTCSGCGKEFEDASVVLAVHTGETFNGEFLIRDKPDGIYCVVCVNPPPLCKRDAMRLR